jgi:hypothetical protein
VWSLPGVVDITEQLRQAESAIVAKTYGNKSNIEM